MPCAGAQAAPAPPAGKADVGPIAPQWRVNQWNARKQRSGIYRHLYLSAAHMSLEFSFSCVFRAADLVTGRKGLRSFLLQTGKGSAMLRMWLKELAGERREEFLKRIRLQNVSRSGADWGGLKGTRTAAISHKLSTRNPVSHAPPPV